MGKVNVAEGADTGWVQYMNDRLNGGVNAGSRELDGKEIERQYSRAI